MSITTWCEALDGKYFKRFGGPEQGVTAHRESPCSYAGPRTRQRSAGPALSASLHSLGRKRTRKQGEGETGTSCSRDSCSRPAVGSAQPAGALRAEGRDTEHAPSSAPHRSPPRSETSGAAAPRALRGTAPSPQRPIRVRASMIDFCPSQSALCLAAPSQTPGEILPPNDKPGVELRGRARSSVSGAGSSQSEQSDGNSRDFERYDGNPDLSDRANSKGRGGAEERLLQLAGRRANQNAEVTSAQCPMGSENRGGGGAGAAAEEEISPEDDQRANRTLFLGNLDITVSESDLRRAFDRFGVITEVDIKRPGRGQTSTYGFLKFENLDMAHRAKLAMSGKVLLRNPIKIGYGKATPTTRLWVGGLGPWVPLAALAREFDRFGTIRTIDYRKGDSWAYIQYESLDAAQAACTHMRGFPLGGPDRRLRVDFADTEHRYQQPYLQPLPLPPPAHYELVAEAAAFGAHRGAPPDPLRGARDRTPPLLYRDRDRDLYPEAEWVPPPPPVRDRGNRAAAYDPLESLERRRDGWSLERDRGERELGSSSRDQPRKRRLAEDGGRHLDRSPDSERSSSSRKRHCLATTSPPDRSPELLGGRERYSSDPERSSRLLLLERPSPIRESRRGSLERGQNDKRDRKNSAERERKHRAAAAQECKSPAKKDERAAEGGGGGSRLKPPPQKQQQDGAAQAGAAPKLCLAWQGMLLLKNSNFPSNMHLLQGDLGVASSLLVEGATGGKVAQLKITQRLRLDQPKLDEVNRRIKVAGPNGYAILLAVPGASDNRAAAAAAEAATTSTQRPLRNLVSYLKQKQAAGVISLPVGGNKDKENSGVLHAFPPCDFSQQFLDSTAKALAKSEDDYLVMIIVRGAS
uniref:RNA binding motif protein 15 n=1 Tax=Ficedula albicollis TaxID=59894 RepID=U3JK84_FICAL